MEDKVYSLDVSNVSTSFNFDYNGDWWKDTTSPYTIIGNSTFSYTNTVYMYQLICPRCKTTNWGQVNQVVTCSGKVGRKACTAKIKAIKDVVDYEVPVG